MASTLESVRYSAGGTNLALSGLVRKRKHFQTVNTAKIEQEACKTFSPIPVCDRDEAPGKNQEKDIKKARVIKSVPVDIGNLIASYAADPESYRVTKIRSSDLPKDMIDWVIKDMASYENERFERDKNAIVDDVAAYLREGSRDLEESEKQVAEGLKKVQDIKKECNAFKGSISKTFLINQVYLKIVLSLQDNILLNLLDRNKEFMRKLSPFNIYGDVYCNQLADPNLYEQDEFLL